MQICQITGKSMASIGLQEFPGRPTACIIDTFGTRAGITCICHVFSEKLMSPRHIENIILAYCL